MIFRSSILAHAGYLNWPNWLLAGYSVYHRVASQGFPAGFPAHNVYDRHRRTGPVSFRGAEVSFPNIFSIACPKIKWFCPNIT